MVGIKYILFMVSVGLYFACQGYDNIHPKVTY